jgi:hypothetical protein
MYNSFILSEDRARRILHYTQCSVREEGFYSLSCEESWDFTIAEWVNFFYVLLKLLLSTFQPVKETVKNL